MAERDFTESLTPKATLAQRSAEQASEEPQTVALQKDATDQVVCRAGDASCAKAHAATVSRSAAVDGTPAARSFLRLQRQYGNRYTRSVMHLARQADHEVASGSAVERSIEGARGGGQALDSAVQRQMGTAFGADFSGVRVHTDARSDSLNRALSAKAFTTGHDIFFSQNAYNPGTSAGRELLAHELTHVVQQNGDQVHRQMAVSQPGDRHEVEADRMARAVMHQEQQATPEVNRSAIARQSPDEEKPVAMKADEAGLQRQPEAPKHKDEDEKKKLHAKLTGDEVSRVAEEEQA